MPWVKNEDLAITAGDVLRDSALKAVRKKKVAKQGSSEIRFLFIVD